MPRLKALLAVAGLSSSNRKTVKPTFDYAPEPIRRLLDESKADLQDDWLFESDQERAQHSSAMDGLTASLGRLRQAVSQISMQAPITVEAQPEMSLGAVSFDADLFDGEPMMIAAGAVEASPYDQLLFGEAATSLDFAPEESETGIFRQAA